MKYTDILVKAKNPQILDETMNALGAAVIQDTNGVYLIENGCYVVRAFGDSGFIEFAIKTQGYGKLCGKRE